MDARGQMPKAGVFVLLIVFSLLLIVYSSCCRKCAPVEPGVIVIITATFTNTPTVTPTTAWAPSPTVTPTPKTGHMQTTHDGGGHYSSVTYTVQSVGYYGWTEPADGDTVVFSDFYYYSGYSMPWDFTSYTGISRISFYDTSYHEITTIGMNQASGTYIFP